MRRWFMVVLAVATMLGAVAVPLAQASPADEYGGPYFGDGNLPPGCIRDMSPDNPDNVCHHMRTELNGLDSPQIDVAILVPVSPTAERDMRIMRQSIEMWEGGIDYLADEMDLPWLRDGVDFHITVDHVDLDGDGDGGELTTYPIVDPEVVVIASNPVGGVGIGIDPIDFVFTDEDAVPCHTVQNPFDVEYWEALPGFDSHHEARTGTYREDCGGAGGNICFAVNGAIDPAPEEIDVFNLFDLVSHEVGHCLTLGHVGDGAEGTWGVLPPNDIMAYSADPVDLNKCVSTLDVEAFATRMSRYLDTNGDGTVDDGDLLTVNDVPGDGLNPFHVQHPDDHLYASSTGEPTDCPQPDLGLVPGERTDWTPDPVATGTEPVLTVGSPADGARTRDDTVTVTGTVERVERTADEGGDTTTSSTTSSDTSLGGLDLLGTTTTDTVADTPLSVGERAGTVTFEDEQDNTFYPEQSTFGMTPILGIDPSRTFGLSVSQPSDVTLTLEWTDAVGGADLDLYVTGAADSGTDGATATPTETVTLTDVTGDLDLRVEPYLVTDPLAGSTYTLTAEVTPLVTDPEDPADADGDGVADADDTCPDVAGDGADGCPVATAEEVVVHVDDVASGRQAVETVAGSDTFSIPVDLPEGDHVLRIEWVDGGEVLASTTRTVTHSTDDDGDGVSNAEDACPGHDDGADSDGDGVPDGCDSEVDGDRDGDGVADRVDSCTHTPNPDQADMDGDGQGDACDNDIDGDGHSNGKEQAHGTDPRDPESHPGRGRRI